MGDAKTRSLRKYEAPATFVSADADLGLMSPFGPYIGKASLEAELVARLNRYCDRQIRPGAGAEFLLPREVVFEPGEASLGHRLEALIRSYVLGVDGVPAGKISIDVVWVVSQYQGSSSPVHFHTGDISGVLYLKTPSIASEQDEERKTYISGRQAGYINFLIGGKQRFSKSLISFRPKVGDFYVFPGWLLHGAEPFRGEGERRSLAFNAFVEAGEA